MKINEQIKVLKSPEWIAHHYAHDTKRDSFQAQCFDGIISMEILSEINERGVEI